MNDEQLLVSFRRGASLLGISERLFHYLKATDPNFPKVVQLGPRTNRVLHSDLVAYVNHLPPRQANHEPLQLAMSRAGGRRGLKLRARPSTNDLGGAE
jgi:hypothetical protein